VRTKKTGLILLTVFTLVIFSISMAEAGLFGSKAGTGDLSKRQRPENLTKELGLSAEQEAKLKAQKDNNKAAMEDIWQKMQEKRGELKAELEKDKVDNARIDAIITDMSGLTTRMLRNRVDQMLATKQILTPEQFKKFQDKAEKKIPGAKKGQGKK